MSAGENQQGNYSIAIGYQSGQTLQPNNSIIINSSGATVNGITGNAFYVAPVRNQSSVTNHILSYDNTNFEINQNPVSTIDNVGNISANSYALSYSSIPSYTSSQIGYTNYSVTSTGIQIDISTVTNINTISGLSQGVYIFNWSIDIDTSTLNPIISAYTLGLSTANNSFTNGSNMAQPFQSIPGGLTISTTNHEIFTGSCIINTSSSFWNSTNVYLNVFLTYSSGLGNLYTSALGGVSYTRIG
jgi:hypothetical protein